MAYVIIPRHDTIAALSALNRIYAEGELILEEQIDGTYKLKVGNGVQTYNLLAYIGGAGGGGSNAFGSIVVSGQSSILADTISDPLTVDVGAGLTATTNVTTDTLTISPLYGTTAGTICQGNDSRIVAGGTPTAHATTHGAGGTDTIKLDALAAPDDVTTLNATASAHGLLRKISNVATQYLDGTHNWTVPPTNIPFVNVKNYGAVGDNSTLNDAAFAAAIAASNGRVYFPGGIYRVSSVVTLNQWGVYFGDGQATIIRTTSATSNVFNVTGAGAIIRDMLFDSTVTRTAGSFVVLSVAETRIENFKMIGAYIGVRVADVVGIAVITIAVGHIRQTVATGTCILIEGGFDVSIRDVISDSVPISSVGISVTKVGDLTIEDCNIIRSNIALSIWPGVGQICASIQANNTFFDTAGTHGVLIVGENTAQVVRCIFDQCWFSSAGTSGVTMLTSGGGTVDGIEFNGCIAALNGSDGIHLLSGVKNVIITGGGFAQNGSAGISMDSGATDIVMNGVRSGNTHGLAGNAHGIYVAAGVSRYIITNSNLLGNTTANLTDAGSAPKVVSGNLT